LLFHIFYQYFKDLEGILYYLLFSTPVPRGLTTP
jgi:hypothetical protein